ncbi:LppM family (lipo)protein [Demequina globuliformis]|uniref:LppM family (lipo)protein n=1 Tax=Demequina globuliformis TaxID=676202 RepID=UPI000784CD96|nr:hypothetical protein [Demequina globuliformis]
MKATARAVALSIVAVLALAGCLKVDMDLTLNSDDTVSGSATIAVAEGTGEAFGLSDEDVLGQIYDDSGEGLPGGVISEYNEDGFVGQTITFENTPLAEFNGEDEDIQVYRDGDFFVVESPTSPTEGANADELPSSAEATMTVTFPGPIEDANGTVDGTTVTWNLFEAEDGIYARGAAEPDSGFSLWIVLAIGLGIGVAVGIAMWLIARGKKPATEGGPGEAGYPAAPQANYVAPPVPTDASQPAAPAPAGDTPATVPLTTDEASAVTPEAPASAYPDAPERNDGSPEPEPTPAECDGTGDHDGDGAGDLDADGNRGDDDRDQEPPAR